MKTIDNNMIRECENCNICCIKPSIDTAKVCKSANEACEHLRGKSNKSCAIYEERPDVCKDFWCSWMRGFGLDHHRPDQTDILIIVRKNGAVHALEAKEGALKTKIGKESIVSVAAEVDVPVIVTKYESVPPNDLGDFIVVKNDLREKAENLIGKLVEFLDDENLFGLYELVHKNTSARKCGECSECCFTAEVEEVEINFYKPSHTKCEFQNEKCGGCEIFGKNNRPKMCSDFQCAWLRGGGNETDRPDKNGILINVNNFNGGTWIFAIELKPNALFTTGKNMVIDIAKEIDLPVIVVDYNATPPNDKGDYVVIKNSLKDRAKALMGDFVGCLGNNDFSVYKLRIIE